jgi:glycosyltransferase involved in cell wall biosynthesis
MTVVSVCIPVYNGADYLRETLESVLTQSLEAIEVVVVDNASTDETPQILSTFSDDRLRVIRNDSTVSVYENWTRAVAATSGTYVKVLAADDLLHPTCLERQLEAFETYGQGVALVASQRSILNEHGNILIPRRGLGRLSGRVDGEHAIARCVRRGTNIFGEGAAVLARGDLIRSALPWPSDYPYMTDLVMWFRLLEQGDLVAIREPLASFRAHQGSWSAEITAAQAQQAASLFNSVAAHPGNSVGRSTVLVGGVRAGLLARLRPIAYLPVIMWVADLLSKPTRRLASPETAPTGEPQRSA